MSEEKKEEPAAAAASPDAGGGGSKLPLIINVVNLVVTLGVVGFLAFQFIQDKKKQALEDIDADAEAHGAPAGAGNAEGGHGEGGAAGASAAAHGDASAYGKMVALEPFTVNLATSGSVQPKFARVNISLEINSEEVEQEVTAKMPQVRNIVLDLFNSKRPSDLQNSEGRNYLKEELRNAINSALVSGKIRGVYFTSFALSS